MRAVAGQYRTSPGCTGDRKVDELPGGDRHDEQQTSQYGQSTADEGRHPKSSTGPSRRRCKDEGYTAQHQRSVNVRVTEKKEWLCPSINADDQTNDSDDHPANCDPADPRCRLRRSRGGCLDAGWFVAPPCGLNFRLVMPSSTIPPTTLAPRCQVLTGSSI